MQKTNLLAGPIGAECIPPSTCDIQCSSDDVSCGDGTCCQQGEVCLELTCGVDTSSKTYTTAGAPFPTVDAMLGGVLGVAAGYFAM